eukprot:Plantae.Rhodophyta-Purpureofilum_apyrenoidigerum.ctg4759.p1 GENE.Plantae.Rhodophyta-Purpureofilum_apyrenoidigerum.ctg4759~~Plantae.Rhodophyta-Purpureofilum_apyrenoidigerum.ctg4759.p1  ORF type:complete len:334 (+),score=26.87 Plantae.Rhodophyta-Purpureofilum_apyrenoidigerum.ctg4759:63-1064(+)
MAVKQFALVVLALIGASMACSCIRATSQEKFDRESWVYTLSILKKVETTTESEYTAEIKGILKTYPDSFHYVGSIIKFYSGRTSCEVYLEEGQYYILGGSEENGKLSTLQCNTVYALSGSPCLVPDCPKGCSSWFDGCNTHVCKDGKSVGSTKRYCFQYKPPKCLEVEQRVCPENCLRWYDGCNICQCNEDGSVGACTRRFCIRQDTPKCIKPRPCVFCTLALPGCPKECKNKCEYVPGTCTTCPSTRCPEPRNTFTCDIFSTWSNYERKICLARERDWPDLCCTQKDCCKRGGRKARYCQKSLCKTFKCVFRKSLEETPDGAIEEEVVQDEE